MMYKIGEVFTLIRNGANIKQGEDDTGYPITRIETISNRFVDRNKMGYAGIHEIGRYSDYILEDGDILMSHINSETHLGKVALYEEIPGETIIHGMNLLCLRPNRSILNCRYAFYSLMSDGFLRQIPRIMKKSVNQASFTVTALKELQIHVPPMEQQLQIVSVMDRIQSLLLQRQKQAAVIDQLVKSRFIELFGEPLSNQKGWQTMSIVEAAPIKSQRGNLADEVWLLNLDAVEAQTGTVLFKHRVQSGEINASTVYFTAESVLYSKLRPYLNKVVMPDEDGVATSEMIPMCPLADRLNRAYLCYWLRSDAFVRHISEKVAGAKMPRVSMDYFRSLAIEMPPLELQEQFAAFVEQTDKSKLAVQKGLQELEILKKSLMQQYFG